MTTTTSGPVPGTWDIDPMHSSVGFTVRHMMVGRVRGRFGTVEGTATVPADPLAASIDVLIDAASFESGNELRDQAVRSGEFLDVKAHPQLRFRSTGIQQDGDRYTMTGDLTVRDVTRPVQLAFTYNGAVTDPFGNDRIGISAAGSLEREDFGLTTNMPMDGGGVVVGSTVVLEFEVQLTRTGD